MSNRERTDGAAVGESLSDERSERRAWFMMHDGTRFVSRHRTCASQAPDEVDVLTDPHLGVKATK